MRFMKTVENSALIRIYRKDLTMPLFDGNRTIQDCFKAAQEYSAIRA
jgi:hypothetical protein